MNLRAQLLQEEIDRRFTVLEDHIAQLVSQGRERAATMQLQMDQRFGAAEHAFNIALAAAEKAVGKAENAAERRFDSVNEFRQTLTDQAATFPTREEVSARLDSHSVQIDRNIEALRTLELQFTSRLDTMKARDTGKSEYRTEQRLSQNTIVSILVALVIATGVVVSILTYAHK